LEIKTLSGLKEPFQGKIVLKTNSKKKPELEIFVTGKLQKEVKVAPPYIYFGIINASKGVIDQKSLRRTVTVTSAREGNLTIEKIETGTDWIKAEVENNNKDGKYSVIITLDEDKISKGEFREKIKIHTKYNKTLEIAHVIIEGKVN